MSITSDLRAYADTAIEQGRTQFTRVASDATHRFGDLRAQAEKTINVDAIKAAVEPYLAQANEYRTAVTDRASGLLDTVTSDKRVAKLVDTAEQLSSTVVDTVTERVVKPVGAITGLTGRAPIRRPATKPTTSSASNSASKPGPKSAAKPAAKPATKPANTRPAPKPSAAKSTTRKAPAKKAASAKA